MKKSEIKEVREILMNEVDCKFTVKGITQRAEWIKADFEDKVAYLNENEFGHPALFPVWMKKQKAYKTEYSK